MQIFASRRAATADAGMGENAVTGRVFRAIMPAGSHKVGGFRHTTNPVTVTV